MSYMCDQGGVLDALGFVYGPGHAEVKLEADGPCLVEVGARCHGWSGTWMSLVSECVGPHNQVEATLDAYLDAEAFCNIPKVPAGLKKEGVCTMLVSQREGTIASVATEKLESLSSFHKAVLGHCHVGDELDRTIDLFTSPGQVLLASDDAHQLEADYASIHEMESELIKLA